MFRKFIDWMKFNPPEALSWDGWQEFREEYKEKAPIRYFLVKVVGEKFTRLGDRRVRISNWIAYRTTYRFHTIDTGLEPGYYDVDTRMLHGNFSLLVDYVERECAWMSVVFDKEAMKKHFGWKRFLPRLIRGPFRDRELGLQHLDWEATLDDPSLGAHEASPDQAKRAREVKALYLWWTEERPKRKELEYPLDDSVGLRTLSAKWKKENPEDAEKMSSWARQSHIQEAAWDDEDTRMLIKLMQLRKGLWT